MSDQHKHDLTWVGGDAFLLCSFSEGEPWHSGKLLTCDHEVKSWKQPLAEM
jgi:hypothetical protein